MQERNNEKKEQANRPDHDERDVDDGLDEYDEDVNESPGEE
jgi:hypothetical protein